METAAYFLQPHLSSYNNYIFITVTNKLCINPSQKSLKKNTLDYLKDREKYERIDCTKRKGHLSSMKDNLICVII